MKSVTWLKGLFAIFVISGCGRSDQRATSPNDQTNLTPVVYDAIPENAPPVTLRDLDMGDDSAFPLTDYGVYTPGQTIVVSGKLRGVSANTQVQVRTQKTLRGIKAITQESSYIPVSADPDNDGSYQYRIEFSNPMEHGRHEFEIRVVDNGSTPPPHDTPSNVPRDITLGNVRIEKSKSP